MDITSKHFIAQNDYKTQKKMNAFFFFFKQPAGSCVYGGKHS